MSLCRAIIDSVGNIPYDITKENIEDMLAELVGRDNVVDVRLHYDRVTGMCTGVCGC